MAAMPHARPFLCLAYGFCLNLAHLTALLAHQADVFLT